MNKKKIAVICINDLLITSYTLNSDKDNHFVLSYIANTEGVNNKMTERSSY